MATDMKEDSGVYTEKKETIDFVYVIDCTGSMSSYINAVRDDINKVIEDTQKNYPYFELRLGCVGYRDWDVPKDRLELLPFTKDVKVFKTFMNGLRAHGGGDTPEDVLGGLLHSVNKLDWQSNLRILFHVCDAPPHNTMYHTCDDTYPNGHKTDPLNYHCVVLKKMKEKNIHLCIAKLNHTVDQMIKVFQNYCINKLSMEMDVMPIKDSSALLATALKSIEKNMKYLKNAKEIKYIEITMLEIKTDMKKLYISMKNKNNNNNKNTIKSIKDAKIRMVKLKHMLDKNNKFVTDNDRSHFKNNLKISMKLIKSIEFEMHRK